MTESGLIIVDKPQGWTSHDVVAKIRKLTGTRRVGHAGTLDPMATGVLVIGVEKATRLLGYLTLAEKEYTQLSGGERQMVLVARALAQETKLLVMDEPASSLDFGNQIRMLTEVKRLSERGVSVLITTHSPNHAFLCASQVAVMKAGRLRACGVPVTFCCSIPCTATGCPVTCGSSTRC